ncbi:MAG TPA: ferritin-like domain-containing protein [Anseongella sp.]|nr:ferritin-like domain-containing protein [Anseongella sp.]
MKDSRFYRLFLLQLQDIYWAENHSMNSIPNLIRAATSADLQRVLNDHREITRGQIERLEKVFKSLDEKPAEKFSHGLKGLAEEGEAVIAATEGDSMVRDAAIIIASQRIEHYEIAAYGTLIIWARQMKCREVAELLNATLDEEKEADALLTEIAVGFVNRGATQE